VIASRSRLEGRIGRADCCGNRTLETEEALDGIKPRTEVVSNIKAGLKVTCITGDA
jgi:hypothetical protein